jgi:hypothetical protein
MASKYKSQLNKTFIACDIEDTFCGQYSEGGIKSCSVKDR